MVPIYSQVRFVLAQWHVALNYVLPWKRKNKNPRLLKINALRTRLVDASG